MIPPRCPAKERAKESGSAVVGALFALTGIVFCLALLEAATRLILDRNGMHYGIEMWKYAKLVKRPSANPLMSHEHAPNREVRLMGVDVRTNAMGLRDRDFSLEKPPATFRILVLGDSLTFGWGVAAETTYPKLLERLLNERHAGADAPKVEVINAGVGNYNTVQEVEYFKARGRELRPDAVVLGFYINDAEPLRPPDNNFLARSSYLYVLASSGWDAFQRRIGWKAGYTAYYQELYTEDNPGWLACRRAIEELIRLCREDRARLMIVLLPELHFPDGEYPFERAHHLVSRLARAHDVAILDLQRAFRGHEPQSLWVSPGDAHPNEKAQRIIAREIYMAMATEAPAVMSGQEH